MGSKVLKGGKGDAISKRGGCIGLLVRTREPGRGKSYSPSKLVQECGKTDYYDEGKTVRVKDGKGAGCQKGAHYKHKSVLFVEQTADIELAKRLRELLLRLAPIMGFSIKVVEHY